MSRERAGHLHLAIATVHPDHGRRGVGTRLIGTGMMNRDGLFVLLLSLLAVSCSRAIGAPPEDGEQLARTYCASCHAFPEPALLDRPSWEAVLPDMGGRLGVYATVPRDSLILRIDRGLLDPALVYPTTPALSPEAWQAITDYFLREAPASLAAEPRVPPVEVGLPGFRVRAPRFRFEPPLTTMVDVRDRNGVFFVGTYGATSALGVLNAQGEALFQWDLPGAPVSAHWDDGRLTILLVGTRLEPSEAADGAIVTIDGPEAPLRPRVTGLKRPVDLDVGDLNGDGLDDFVVCEFGNETGYLSWYENAGDGTYRRHVLSTRAGAIEAVLHDFDADGTVDVGVLMAQGDEGVDLYFNDGVGRFHAERVLRFPPVYGSTHLALADFDADGVADLLYTNGDNADVTPVLKPFHGVRIFLGAADGSFRERFFFPLHGTTRAEAADFDGDGDLDVAAIAYFPDYARTPEESFVLLENQGAFTFAARTFEDSFRGRWMTMDVGDVDRDGDPDVLLGSNVGFAALGDTTGLFARWRAEAPSFLLLENTR